MFNRKKKKLKEQGAFGEVHADPTFTTIYNSPALGRENNDISMACVYASPESMDRSNDSDIAMIYAAPDFMRNEAVEMREVYGMPSRIREAENGMTRTEYPFNHAVFEDETCRICSSCGEAVPFSKKFCPNCGAYMSSK